MRIAVVGSHSTGKSTLVDQLAGCLDGFNAIEEPYYALLDEGYVFADPPRFDDFVVLVERSLRGVSAPTAGDVIFDRCPADYLAYRIALHGPSSDPDTGRLRRRVDAVLRDMVVNDEFGFTISVIEVCGSPTERITQIRLGLRTIVGGPALPASIRAPSNERGNCQGVYRMVRSMAALPCRPFAAYPGHYAAEPPRGFLFLEMVVH